MQPKVRARVSEKYQHESHAITIRSQLCDTSSFSSPDTAPMMTLSCPAKGCKFTTNSDRSLALHLGKCKKAVSGLASVAESVGEYGADRRQAKRCKISFLESSDVRSEVEEPMGVELEVCL